VRTALDYSMRTRGETADLSIAGMNNIGIVYYRIGRGRDAIAVAQKLFDLRRRLNGADAAAVIEERRPYFLKKRSKKLLLVG